jgi:hypothetical protein
MGSMGDNPFNFAHSRRNWKHVDRSSHAKQKNALLKHIIISNYHGYLRHVSSFDALYGKFVQNL